MKWTTALLIAAVYWCSGYAQSISSVSPYSADAGQPLSLTISGDGFLKCEEGMSHTTYCTNQISSPSLNMFGVTISTDSFSVRSTSLARCYVRIPPSASPGTWALNAGPASASFTINPACDSAIDNISPDSVESGKKVTISINANHAHFLYVHDDQSVSRNISTVTISNGDYQIMADSFSISSFSNCQAYFTLPDTIPGGRWDVTVLQIAIRTPLTLTRGLAIKPKPRVVKVVPDSGAPGQALTLRIFGRYTQFLTGATDSSAVTTAALFKGADSLYARNATAASDTLVSADFSIPTTATAGQRSIWVKGMGLPAVSLANCFRITSSTQYLPAVRVVGSDSLSCTKKNKVLIRCSNAHFMGRDSVGSNVDSVTMFTDSVSVPADSFRVNSDSQLTATFTPIQALLNRTASLRVILRSDSPLVKQNCLKVIAPTAVASTAGRSRDAMSVRFSRRTGSGFIAEISLPARNRTGLKARLFTIKGELVHSWNFSGTQGTSVTLKSGTIGRGLLMLQLDLDGTVKRFPVLIE